MNLQIVPQPLTIVNNSILPCTISTSINENYLDGTFDVAVSSSQKFYPQIQYSIINPTNQKPIKAYVFDPTINCNPKFAGETVTASGSVKYLVAVIGTDNKYHNILSTSNTLPTRIITNGHNNAIDLPIVVSADQINSALSSSDTKATLAVIIYPSISFNIKELNQNSFWNGQYTMPNIYMTKTANQITTSQQGSIGSQYVPPFGQQGGTNVFPATNGPPAIPVTAKVSYTITYEDKSKQVGTSANIIGYKLNPLDLYKQTTSKTRINDLSYVLYLDFGSLSKSVAISNSQFTLGGTVIVGSRPQFHLQSSDFVLRTLNDPLYGLASVELPVNNLESEIETNAGKPQQNGQPTTVSLTLDGTYDMIYNNIHYKGILSNLSWTFDTVYGSVTNTDVSTQNGGSACQSPNTSSGKINPNGGSPSSGQSFDCSPCSVSQIQQNYQVQGNQCVSPNNSQPTGNNGCDSTTQYFDTNSQTCKPIQVQNNPSSNTVQGSNVDVCTDANNNVITCPSLSGDPRSKPTVNEPVSGFCTDTTDTATCIAELLNIKPDSSPNTLALVVLVVIVSIIAIIIGKKRR